MQKESTFLLKTKLYIPPRRPNLVVRPRLIASLGEALRLQHRLTLISARAGSGKTTLVSEWLHRQERPFAWLSLDANDNDPWRFYGYLVEALRQLDITTGRAGLGEPDLVELPPVEDSVTGLINDIASASIPFILVLDDYHVIQNDWIHKAIGFLVEHEPPEMHLIITTRADPQLPLAQLRARNQLSEIRDRDLLFTAVEAAEFLNQVQELDLPADAVATIGLRTEGWIAGLQMAAISAQGHKLDGDLDVFIHAFGGTNRFILDYLTEEVLNQQSPAIQDFLIETSILERMCGDLCDAMRSVEGEAPGSQAILTELERKNLFVIPLDDDRHWYRYHHLFADLLQSALRQRRSAEQIRELHRRAGQWYQDQGSPGEAMDHILVARDFEQAAAIIDENIARLLDKFSRSNEPLLLSWIEQLPAEVKRSRPWIDVYRANMLALNLQLDGVEPILADAEKRIEPGSSRALEMRGHIAAIRAYSANLRGNATRALEMAALAGRYLPGDSYLAARGMVAFVLADTYFAGDDMENADLAFTNLLRIGESADQLLIIVPAICDLAAIRIAQGKLHQAEKLFSKAHRWMVERNSLDSRVICSYEFGQADLLREWNRLDAAREYTMSGIEHRKRLGGYQVIGDLALMRLLQAQGDAEGAMRALREAERAVQSHPFQLALMIEFRTSRVLQWLAVGDVDTASRWAKDCSGGSEREQITLARLLLSQDRAAEAQNLLARQRPLAETGGRTGRLIEILALQAIALDAQGLSTEAESLLSQALSLARPEGFLRLFLDLGRPLREVLERLAGGGAGIAEDARPLLDAFRQEKGEETTLLPTSSVETLIDPLTGRELEVLQLIAEGLSNKEIAGRLFVTPGTVKQHLKNISRKLEAHGRMQVVRRGRELKLL